MADPQANAVDLRSWGAEDLPLLQALLGDPAMMAHLGGPETPEQIAARHARYCRLEESGTGHMFVIVVGPERTPAGSVGYWERELQGAQVWEAGWSVLPAFQGRGIATRGTAAALAHARAVGTRRFVHAYPDVDNAASNAVCRNAGFALQGTEDAEYPRGHWIRVNDWRFDLFPPPGEPPAGS